MPEISKANSDLIKEYLLDMKQGLNVSCTSKRDPRSYVRLNVLRQRMAFMAKGFGRRFNLSIITEVSEP